MGLRARCSVDWCIYVCKSMIGSQMCAAGSMAPINNVSDETFGVFKQNFAYW